MAVVELLGALDVYCHHRKSHISFTRTTNAMFTPFAPYPSSVMKTSVDSSRCDPRSVRLSTSILRPSYQRNVPILPRYIAYLAFEFLLRPSPPSMLISY
ncbi:hypothetical protein I7I53_05568 [Histoplasma capsulatum var. duboisii H88]|uniref:Uncharacterized protein n=1 Tax=Ajellomyces capsulatus (strain H88) TaxID=544711 RepID=A0A8A1LYB5_AJEC8|nr:hypothetical protein I7I53_05568 [Histoplasma capsulatum var. duboisii H88]